MKKILTVLALAVFALTACNDDEDNFIPKKPAATFAGQLPTQVGNYSFEYDKLGRCTTVKSGSQVEYAINYDKGTITLDQEEAQISFNKQGYITKISQKWDYTNEHGTHKGAGVITYKYNGSGQLVESHSTATENSKEDGVERTSTYNSTNTYTWENGNLTKSVCKEEETDDEGKSEYHSTYTIKYGSQANKAGQNTYLQADVLNMEDGDVLVQIGLFGKATALLPISCKEESYTKEKGQEYRNENEYSVNYELNENGTIKVEHIDNRSFTYSYTAVDALISKSASVQVNAKKPTLRSMFVKHHNK